MSFIRYSKREEQSHERGSVMLEFGFVVAGLFLGALVFIDTARLIHQYLILTHVASEGTLLLSRTPELLIGTHTDEDQTAATVSACNSAATSSGFPCGHLTVQRKVRFLLGKLAKDIHLPETHIVSDFDPTAVGGGPIQTVFVEVQTELEGFIIPNVPISASHVGPYLVK